MKLLVSLVVACCLLSPSTAIAQENGSIIERNTYQFPSYEKAVEATDVERYTDRTAYQTAVEDNRFEFQKLKYMSDGLKVVTYLYKPKHSDGRKFPTIIFNRPSVVRGDIAPELISFCQRFAAEGFVILVPMLRQSDGSEGRDEVGGADVNDLMNVLPVVRSLAFVDMNNLFMYGASRGGMMTYQAINRGFPINAAAVFGAFTDMQELLDTHPQQYPLAMLTKIWPNYQAERIEITKARSAIFWPERLNVPLLIMHGGKDRSVNTTQSLALAQELQKLGRVYELVIYAEDNHSLSKNQEERDRRTISWFKRYMKQSVSAKSEP